MIPGQQSSAECEQGRTHSRLVDPSETDPQKLTLCGIQFSIEKPPSAEPCRNAKTEAGVYWGVFYRQDEPYIVRVDQGSTAQFSAILLAPKASPTRYLPLDWNLFAGSTATLRFTGGMSTQYKEKIGSEALGLLSLPADVIDAYFSAVGSIVEKIGAAASGRAKADTTVAQQETALAEQEKKRLLAEEKLRLCQEAIRSHDNAKISMTCQ